MNKKNVKTFTVEELGLKRVVAEGHRYIDITPFWIDSKESIRLWNMLEGEPPHPEKFIKREAERK